MLGTDDRTQCDKTKKTLCIVNEIKLILTKVTVMMFESHMLCRGCGDDCELVFVIAVKAVVCSCLHTQPIYI